MRKDKNIEDVSKKCSIKKLSRALLKKALGYSINEIAEEYVSGENDELKLIKRKVTTKHIPPDIPAAKILIEMLSLQTSDIKEMSDVELEREKHRLIEIISKVGNLNSTENMKNIESSTDNDD
ncbi:MAG: hypothetical protein WCX32_02090 [Clostridia bacterium]|nr:hypothetical protein [Clostridia bacterium]MDD4275638.1 hypothetical protein [Clostridia bacterium]